MRLEPPTLAELRETATRYGFKRMTDDELHVLGGFISATVESLRRLDELEEPELPVRYPRDGGSAPKPGENPLNGWVWRCSIKGSDVGPLAEKRVAIKDNVSVAGIPMKNGSRLLENYMPESDATLVTRILDAGGEIVGKAACEYLSFSGSSFTMDTPAVLNPHDPTRTAGGSSSGSGALVVAGEVDIANGGDQAGSIRIPASFCGAYGMKPSYGLVPATGIFPIEHTVDHVGPLAATVSDLALFLDAIAGEDPFDPRQKTRWAGTSVASYNAALGGDVSDLRVGVVPEGFGWPVSESDVDEAVRSAAHEFEKLGAKVTEISLPMHRDGMYINMAILLEGSLNVMLRGNGMGTNWKGRYSVSLVEELGKQKAERADELSDVMKVLILLGTHLQERYHGRYYAKAQNLGLALDDAYEAAFRDVDLLVMPSTPQKATPLPTAETSREDRWNLVLNMIHNTAPTCVTGHPAISVPCARSNGLPIGMMLIGRYWDDATVLRAAHAFEQAGVYGDVRPVAMTAA